MPNRWRQHPIARRWARVLLAGFALAFAAIITVANRGTGRHYWGRITHIPFWDKLGHIGLLTILSLLLNVALDGRRAPARWDRFLLGSVLLSLVMVMEEFSQLYLPHRTFDILDAVASLAGIAIGGWITRRIARRAGT